MRVVEVKALGAYCLHIQFADGVEGTLDLSSLMNDGVFLQLRDPEQFEKVYVDPCTNTVAWPHGIDLCPDALYADILARQRAA